MKHIVVREYGDTDVMKLEDGPLPEPGAGQVRVKVAAAGLNMIDTYKRAGVYKPALPFTPGEEASGTVDAIGEGVTLVKPGERVAYGFTQGAYAEYAIVPEAQLVPVPDALDLKLAAALMLQGMTAQYLTHDTFPLQPGQTCLIHAAAGGTGQLVVQIAKLRGARVIGTASTEEKVAIAREAGADEVIRYSDQDFEAETMRLTGGKGVDVVYDSVGKNTFDKSLNVLRKRGYLVLFGQSSGAVAPLDPQTLNAKGSLFLTRPSLGSYLQTREELLYRANAVLGWAASGQLKVRIDRELPLSEAAEAHQIIESGATKGKVLLIP
ncbi:MAG: quinone oxidoreductase [Anaerolineae bacterium]|nr:quinone oxidoreductase [Anaerolineae bacterium]